MAAGAALITASSLAYFDLAELPPFVIEKLPVRWEALWLASLRVHVAAVLVAFPLCILLMTRALQRRVAVHRWVGRVAGTLVLFFAVPSGAVLSLEAKGGAPVTAGFLLSGALIGWFMVKGVLAARRNEIAVHRRAMLHVFAQMSVAVTSRAMLFALDAAGVSPGLAYVVALWVPVLGSALAAEIISGSLSRFPRALRRMVHGVSSVEGPARAVRPVARPLARAGR